MKFQITNITVNILIKTQVIFKLSESNSQKKEKKLYLTIFQYLENADPNMQAQKNILPLFISIYFQMKLCAEYSHL